MTLEIKKLGQISEGEFPEMVYKYRDWKNTDHQKILSEKKVWFARPSSFEDKYDCKNPIRYDLLTQEQIYETYLFLSKEENRLGQDNSTGILLVNGQKTLQ